MNKICILAITFSLSINSVIASAAQKNITIEVRRIGLHAKGEVKIKYNFTLKSENEIDGIIISKGEKRNIVQGKYLSVINRIISSPLLTQKWKTINNKRCVLATSISVKIDDKIKEMTICENPYQLNQQQKAVLNWAKYFIN